MGDFMNTSTFGQQAICHNAQVGISLGRYLYNENKTVLYVDCIMDI